MLAGNDGKKEKAEKGFSSFFPLPIIPARSLFKALSGGESSQRLLTAIRPKFDAGGSGGSLPRRGSLI